MSRGPIHPNFSPIGVPEHKGHDAEPVAIAAEAGATETKGEDINQLRLFQPVQQAAAAAAEEVKDEVKTHPSTPAYVTQ